MLLQSLVCKSFCPDRPPPNKNFCPFARGKISAVTSFTGKTLPQEIEGIPTATGSLPSQKNKPGQRPSAGSFAPVEARFAELFNFEIAGKIVADFLLSHARRATA